MWNRDLINTSSWQAILHSTLIRLLNSPFIPNLFARIFLEHKLIERLIFLSILFIVSLQYLEEGVLLNGYLLNKYFPYEFAYISLPFENPFMLMSSIHVNEFTIFWITLNFLCDFIQFHMTDLQYLRLNPNILHEFRLIQTQSHPHV